MAFRSYRAFLTRFRWHQGVIMEHSTQASLLQAHATEQQRILRSTRVDINVVLETVQGTQNPSHNLLRSARNIQPRPAKTLSVSQTLITILTIIGGTDIK